MLPPDDAHRFPLRRGLIVLMPLMLVACNVETPDLANRRDSAVATRSSTSPPQPPQPSIDPPGSRSGRHRHVMEEQLFVLRGRGYDIHDGARWNWERGDLINIPPMTEHQHFNLDAEEPVLLYSSMPSMGTDLGLGGIEQFEDAPEMGRGE